MASPHHHTPDSLLQLLTSLLPQLSTCPLPPLTQAQLSSLCVGLKQVGRHLELSHASTLDALQQQLTALCQDPAVDIVLRLQLLEVVELRTLGWQRNPQLESYYRERQQQHGGSGGAEEGPVAVRPALAMAQDWVLVKGVQIVIKSEDAIAVAKSKQVLEEFFTREIDSVPQVSSIYQPVIVWCCRCSTAGTRSWSWPALPRLASLPSTG